MARDGGLRNGDGGEVRASVHPKISHSCSLMWSLVGSLQGQRAEGRGEGAEGRGHRAKDTGQNIFKSL